MLKEAPTIHPSARVVTSTIGKWTEIGPGCDIEETLLGDYSYAIRDVTAIYATIGKFCSIASHVRIHPVNHPMHRVSQHHFTYRRRQFGFDSRDDEELFAWRRAQACFIGHDVWIGHNSLIMPGVTVGTGSVIAAGAVVTKNVAPYQIVAGVPARPLRMRFPEATVDRLLAISWWDWEHDVIKGRLGDFLDMGLFLEKYGR
jgi:phosphonate metabolism protein (transferase hexapeptide repeat family)